MGEEGEKTCPLCAEEMDLTDQQLKPCKCGYEICVWCWHHIMEMAEKDESEGRCPACRSPYNKDKIVGAAASCERLVTELNTEKKVKSNKGKSKTSEGRKQLSSVRVIQRNLVYIVGLPLNLADEDLLQRKEYFGQYGKVLKVSISRTTSGAIQHFANNTCSVYITYLKEEEALRCIQSVHGFVLEGRSLRACYGTTKYCHSWLRNVPCSNPDCLYLHETGLQEDSFSKDELISAYTRNRVQQVTGAIDSTQRRYGSALPPPADDYCSKTTTNGVPGGMKVSPPSSSCGRSAALPAGASWGMRASSNPPTSGSLSSSNGPHKQKVESMNGSVTFSAVLASSNPMVLPKKDNNLKEKSTSQEESKLTVKLGKECIDNDFQTESSDNPITSGSHNIASISSKGRRSSSDKYADSSANTIKSDSLLSASCGPGPVEGQKDISNEKINKSCSDVTSISSDRHLSSEEGCLEQCKIFDTSLSAAKTEVLDSKIPDSGVKFDVGLVSEASGAVVALSEDKSDVVSFDEQRLKDPEFVSTVDYLTNFSGSINLKGKVRSYPGQLNGTSSLEDLQTVHKRVDSVPHTSGTPALLNGYPENNFSSSAALSRNTEHSYSCQRDEKPMNLGRFENVRVSTGCNGASDIGEDSIISNILSLDIDSWDASLTSPQNLAKFLGETDRQKGSLKVSAPWKLHQSNQSRFSFAREESADLAPDAESVKMEQAFRSRSFGHGANLDKIGCQNGEERDFFSNSHSDISSSKLSVSRPQVSAPPGFLTPGRAPPPGFAAHERIEQQISNSPSGNYQIGASSLLRNHYQVPLVGNAVSDADVEFIDPAILAVGKGRFADGLNNSPGLDMRSSFSPQLRTFENDAKFQLLMQRSTQQNHRFDVGDSFSMFGDSFRFQPSVVEQSLVNNISQFSQVGLSPHSRSPWPSNGHWDSWKEVQGGNNLGMPELLNRERLGFNKFYNGYEESKLQMPNQGDIYGRHFGI